VNLASDVPGLARVTDPNLVNPWGVAYSPTGPFWFAENGSGVSDFLDGRGKLFSLVVTVRSAAHSGSAPTGTVFNSGAGFAISENGVSAPSRFLFVSEDGTISGWTAVVDPTRALVAVDNSSFGSVYTGLALAADPNGHSFLYAADFRRGTIDVFDQSFRTVIRPGVFRDPNLPDGFAPFNIQNINKQLFVTYARQNEDRSDAVAGAGQGFVDVYDTGGSLVRRFASEGELDSPWGLALAPADFGPFGSALLVGNNGDGHINAYDPGSGTFLGQIASEGGIPIAFPNLWALAFGNGHAGGDSETLFFTAGVGGDAHGLFGAIQSPERQGADTAGAGAFDPDAPGEPGDYPLPPRDGPTFRASGEDRPIPVVDLLPLSESSLVLVPTLSTITQPRAPIDAAIPAARIVVVASGGPVSTAFPASNAVTLVPGDGNTQPARGDSDGAVALNAFLDLNVMPNSPEQAGVQWLGTNLDATTSRSWPSAGRDAGSQSGEEQGSGVLPPTGQTGEVPTAVPPLSRTKPADDHAASDGPVENRHDGKWTNLIKAISVVCITTVWTYWMSHVIWCRPVSLGDNACRKAGCVSIPHPRLLSQRDAFGFR
jgi:uncharacterized protein (TIGR03118 family)